MKTPLDLKVLVVKLLYSALAFYRDPARYKTEVFLFALLENAYTSVRVWHALANDGQTAFVADERVARPDLPTWWLCCTAIAFLLSIVSLPCWYVAPSLVRRFAMRTRLKWRGAFLMIVGIGLQHASHASLGRNWSTFVEAKADQQLVTRGLYHYVRHPMYTAFCVYAVGHLLLVANWLVGLSFGAVIALTCLRIPTEEAMMVDQFGDAYRTYQARTGALLPEGGLTFLLSGAVAYAMLAGTSGATGAC